MKFNMDCKCWCCVGKYTNIVPIEPLLKICEYDIDVLQKYSHRCCYLASIATIFEESVESIFDINRLLEEEEFVPFTMNEGLRLIRNIHPHTTVIHFMTYYRNDDITHFIDSNEITLVGIIDIENDDTHVALLNGIHGDIGHMNHMVPVHFPSLPPLIPMEKAYHVFPWLIDVRKYGHSSIRSYKGEITVVPTGHEFCLPGTKHFCLQDGN